MYPADNIDWKKFVEDGKEVLSGDDLDGIKAVSRYERGLMNF